MDAEARPRRQEDQEDRVGLRHKTGEEKVGLRHEAGEDRVGLRHKRREKKEKGRPRKPPPLPLFSSQAEALPRVGESENSIHREVARGPRAGRC